MFRLDVFCLALALIAVFVCYGVLAAYTYEGIKSCFFVFFLLAVPAFLGGRFSRSNAQQWCGRSLIGCDSAAALRGVGGSSLPM